MTSPNSHVKHARIGTESGALLSRHSRAFALPNARGGYGRPERRERTRAAPRPLTSFRATETAVPESGTFQTAATRVGDKLGLVAKARLGLMHCPNSRLARICTTIAAKKNGGREGGGRLPRARLWCRPSGSGQPSGHWEEHVTGQKRVLRRVSALIDDQAGQIIRDWFHDLFNVTEKRLNFWRSIGFIAGTAWYRKSRYGFYIKRG